MANKEQVLYSIHLEHNHTLSTAFRAAWDQIKQDLNLKDDSYEYLLDWVTREAWNQAFKLKNIELIGHHRSDEGKCIVDTYLTHALVNVAKRMRNLPFSAWEGDTVAKIMVLDGTVVVSHQLTKRTLT